MAIAAKQSANFLAPPLQLVAPAMTQIVMAVPAGLTQQAQNLLQVTPLRALSVCGEDRAWVIPLGIAGLSTVSVRASYRDLHMTPGIRGVQISYPLTTANPTIKCNATGMVYTLPVGPADLWHPLFM